MLVRIVKMSFDPDHIQKFLADFDQVKSKIRAFEGCEFLELYREQQESTVFFTYSYWKSDTDLENYRQSDLFKGVWAKTKPLFNAKPEAWSVDKLVSME